MVTGRTKGITFRGKGNVVLVAAQLDDANGNPTEEYVLLRADEFGRLRTIDAGAAAAGANDKRQLKGIATERWSVPGWYSSNQGTGNPPANEMLWIPILVPQTRTYTRIGIVVTAGGGGGTVARLGIYNATLDADGLTPSSLVLDAGTVPVDGVASVEIVIAETLTGNTWYFLVFVTDGTPALADFEIVDGIVPPVGGSSIDLIAGSDGDLDFTAFERPGVGIGALADPSIAPTVLENPSRAGYVRLRDI